MQVPMPLLNQPPDDQVRVFESRDHVLDEEATARLAALVKDADLAAPPVALPDFHQEENMEAPCSIAVATREFIRPTLSNAAVNCGMALISLDDERPSESAITSFYDRIRESMPTKGGSSTVLSHSIICPRGSCSPSENVAMVRPHCGHTSSKTSSSRFAAASSSSTGSTSATDAFRRRATAEA